MSAPTTRDDGTCAHRAGDTQPLAHREAAALGADMQFGEDAIGRARSVQRSIWPSSAGLRGNDSSNVSMRRRKMMRAGSNHDYRHQILFGQLAPRST